MARLFLVRHAQASFLSENYDRLSALGEAQARLLGEFWVRRKMTFDRVCVGPALRHRQTVQIVAAAYRESALRFPESTAMDEWDEFQGEALLSASLPELLLHNSDIRKMHDTMQKASCETEKRAAFQRLFEAIVSMWVNGDITPRNVEPWEDFCARVNRGLSVFLANAEKGEVSVVFTSGGPISVAGQRALHLSPQDTLRVTWMSRNCSFSEFLFSGDRLTLSSFNAFPHLNDDALLTYR